MATRTNVAYSATSLTLLAARQRAGFLVFNDTDRDLFLAYGTDPDTVASSSDYSVKIAAGAYYESVWSDDGAVYGIWASGGSGAARVTEFG